MVIFVKRFTYTFFVWEKKGGNFLQEWWSNIPAFEKVFWYFAIPFSVLFSIQTVLTFLGMTGDGFDVDDGGVSGDGLDFDGDDSSGFDTEGSFPIFTVRNFIIFFTIFGWTGIAASNSGMGSAGTLILAIVLAATVMFLVAGIFYFMSRMTESGNINIANAIGNIGEVYIPIPAKRAGTGKIQMQIQGAIREIDAVTDDNKLSTGMAVKVVGVINNQVLLVEKSVK